MGFVKVIKNNAYYKRLQVKYRRRREGKTDYHARRKMVAQAKNKYNTPKYRLVVRRTNRKIICQVVFSTIMGDRVLCQATSTELANYGLPCGLTNYAACYATGLLIARRALTVVGLADSITGVEEATGEKFMVVEDEELEIRPFKVILDVGLTRTIVGARCFGILKGAVDGGLHLDHKLNNFPGYNPPMPDAAGNLDKINGFTYDAEAHLERITGGHVGEYMEKMKEEDPEKYAVHFSAYVKAGIDSESVQDTVRDCHKKIRANPVFTKKDDAGIKNTRFGNLVKTSNGNEYTRQIKMSRAQKQGRVKQKMQTASKKLLAAEDADE